MNQLKYLNTPAEIEYEKRRRLLQNDLMELANSISLISILNESKKSHLLEMNVSPAFYQTIETTLWSYVIVSTWKYYDESRSDVYGMAKHLKWVSANLNIFSVEAKAKRQGVPIDHPLILGSSDLTNLDVAEYKKMYVAQRKSSKPIGDSRSNIYAHRNEKLLRVAFDPVSLIQIKEAFDCIFFILDQISVCWNGTHYFPAVSNINDITQTLEIVRSYRENGGYHWAFEQPEISE